MTRRAGRMRFLNRGARPSVRAAACIASIVAWLSPGPSFAATNGEFYVQAYNELARMLNVRWGAAGYGDRVAYKAFTNCENDDVTQADLDLMRRDVLSLASNRYVMMVDPVDPSSTSDRVAFHHGLRISGGNLVSPSVMDGVGNNGMFTKIPGDYVASGDPIYSNRFTDAPVLWVHFEELHKAMQRMYITIGGAALGVATTRTGVLWGPAFNSYGEVMAAAEAGAANPLVPNYTPVPPPYAQASLGYSEFMDRNFYPARTGHIYSAGLVSLCRQARFQSVISNSFKSHFFAYSWRNGDDWSAPAGLEEEKWSKWSTKESSGPGNVYSDTLGFPDIPPWCDIPPPGIGGKSAGFAIADGLEDIRVVTEWSDLYTPVLTDPSAEDDSSDGLVDQGCAACQGSCSASVDESAKTHGVNVKNPMAKSSATYPLQVNAYLREYQIQDLPRQMFSLDTRVAERKSNPGEGWEFVLVKRPSGADVIFALSGARAGCPLNDLDYRLRRHGTSEYEIVFPSSGHVVHRFTTNGSLSAVYEYGKISALLAGNPTNWPGLAVERDAAQGGRVVAVRTSKRRVSLVYDGCAARFIEHRDTNNVLLFRNAVTNGSRIYQRYDAAGNLVEQTRVISRAAEGETEIRYGLDTNAPVKVTLRRESYDSTNNIAVLKRSEWLLAADRTNASATISAPFPWGWETIREIEGYGSPDESVTRYAYYTNASDGANYGLLKSVESDDGSWTRYTYDAAGRVLSVTAPFKNAEASAADALCRVTRNYYAGDPALAGLGFPSDLTFTNDSRPRLVVEQALGVEIGRTYYAYYGPSQIVKRCTSPGAAWTSTGNLAAITHFFTNGTYAGRARRVENEDGTIALSGYATDAVLNQLITTNETGAGVATVTNGTRTVTWTDTDGSVLQRKSFDLPSGLVLAHSVESYDALGRLVVSSNVLNGLTTRYSYECCDLPVTVTDQEGVTTHNTYDELKRLQSSTRLGVTTWNMYDAAGRTIGVRHSAPGETDRITGTQYDNAGRAIAQTDEAGQVTTFAESITPSGERVTTTVQPDGTTVEQASYRDGRVKSSGGTAVHPTFMDYGVDSSGEFTVTYQGPDAGASQWVKSYQNMLGQHWLTVYADGYAVTNAFDNRGRQVRQADGQTTSLLAYDGNSQAYRQALDLNANNAIDLAGTDRVTENTARATNLAGVIVQESISRIYPTNNSGTPLIASTTRRAADGRKSWTLAWGLTNATDISWNPATTTRTETVTAPDGTRTVSHYTNSRLGAVERRDATNGLIAATIYSYDGFGRARAVSEKSADGSIRTTVQSYDVAGRVTGVVVSAGSLQQVTAFAYDIMGRRVRTVLPDGGEVTYRYADTGELIEQAGARTYPVRYAYDAQGRLAELSTFRNGLGGPADATRWNYEPARGFLASKQYADGSSVAYTYWPNGALKRRTWARGATTDYFYDKAGGLTGMVYGGAASNVFMTLDRLGRPLTVRDGMGVQTNVYEGDSQLARETFGARPGTWLQYNYDAKRLVTNVALNTVSGKNTLTLLREVLVYDAAGRVSRVSDTTQAVDYAYAADGRSVAKKTYLAGARLVLTVTNSFDGLGRLTRTVAAATNSPAMSYSYAYNLADQRVTNLLADGSRWEYAYDALGQVTQGRKIRANGQPTPAASWAYDYDTIGNRTLARLGLGTEALEESYAANGLNQIVSRTLPGALFESGTARVDAVVSVGATNQILARATRISNEYWRVVSITNGTAPALFTNVTLGYVVSNTNVLVRSVAQPVLVRSNPERFSYDADGNLVADGLYSNTWDGENRLVQVETLAAVPDGAKVRVRHEYDHRGRRVKKTVYSAYSNGLYRATNTCMYLYEGWNVIAELATGSGASATNYYLWGLDVSGTRQGAGGVGGLLYLRRVSTQNMHTAAYVYDGIGNVMGLAATSNSTWSAQYEYGPFGETIRADGPQATNNNFRFSTKYTDRETGLLYYGFRYYSPQLGRWLSRDPIGEPGGLNLFSCVGNNPVLSVDPLGLYQESGHFYTTYIAATIAGRPEMAYTLALYSQLPDEMKSLTAFDGFPSIPPVIANLISSGQLEKHFDAIQRLLHSLDGGTAGTRRDCLRALLKDQGLLPWERGLIIHAFGDSYAHSYDEVLYEAPIGHGAAGHKPDYASDRPDLYASYLSDLVLTLNGGPITLQQSAQIQSVVAMVNRLHTQGVPGGAENAAFRDLAVEQFSYSPIGYTPESFDALTPKDYLSGPGQEMAGLPTQKQIDELLEKIRKACCKR